MSTSNEPRDHHTTPQFLLRNFATSDCPSRINTASKNGDFAVWKERSIKGIGFERDFYIHMEGDRHISVESRINHEIETPISQSQTWAKVQSNECSELDHSDRPILYSLVRHLEARTPHFLSTIEELSEKALDPSSGIEFSDEELEMYSMLRANPDLAKSMSNAMAVRPFHEGYENSLVLVARSPIRLRTSTTPVLPLGAPDHPALDLPLPGMVAFQRVVAINPWTFVAVVDGDFKGAFINTEVDVNVALGLNRNVVGQFSHFPAVRHMICDRYGLNSEMEWAGFRMLEETPKKVVVKRTSEEADNGLR